MSHSSAAVRRTHRPSTGRESSLTPLEWTLLVAIAAVLLVIAATSGSARPHDVGSVSVRVEPGDTVWSIARSHPARGLTTAQTVDLILDMNGVDSPRLIDGQSLLVPSGPEGRGLAMR